MRRTNLVVTLAAAMLLVLLPAAPASAATDYGDKTLSGGFQSGHFDDIWDLTDGDMTLDFTYDGNGLVDDAGAHAWAQLGVRTAVPAAQDFNPYFSGFVYAYATTVDLLADQDIDVGEVTVTSDATNLYVSYHLDAGWCMTQSHFAVATSLAGLPQTSKGNAIPGQFPYGASYDPCVSGDVALDPIPFSGTYGSTPTGPILYFAAHAVVWDPSSTASMQVCSDGNEAYTAYNNALLGPDASAPDGRTGTAKAANEPYGIQVDTTMSVWDQLVGAPFANTDGSADCSDWIWEDNFNLDGKNYPVNPNHGDRVTFTDTFTLPGPFQAGTLWATADNAYEAYVNTETPGSPLISGQVSGDWWNSDLRQASVDTNNWQSVESSPLTGLTVGANFLFFRAANEYMQPDDNPNNYGTDPYQGGIKNPGGLIYRADVEYYTSSETAWGEGTGFPGKNWSMYFSITPTATAVTGSGVWLATDYDWTVNTFDPDVTPTLDLDDKLILQRQGGQGEGAYNLPSPPPAPGNNHRVWWDRDGVDPWQNGQTANTGGIYHVVITLHATSATTGTAYMNIRGLDQGFETDGNWNTIELTPAGMTFGGDMTNLQVFYGLYGYGATHSVSFTDITVTQV